MARRTRDDPGNSPDLAPIVYSIAKPSAHVAPAPNCLDRACLPLGCSHRLANPGKIELELIEMQSRVYLR